MKLSPQEVAQALGTCKARRDKAQEQMYNPTIGNGNCNRSFFDPIPHVLKCSLIVSSPYNVTEGKVLLD